MNRQILLDQYEQNLKQLEGLASGIPADRAAEQPSGIRNHPAWTLVHLCVGNDFALLAMGQTPLLPAELNKLAGNGSLPSPDASIYPSIADSLALLRRQHDAVVAAVRAAPDSAFEQPAPEPLRAFFPTVAHFMTYFLAVHEQNHLGQLQAWKRAAGLAKG